LTPLAFRIWDFKSITDSGECQFSADNITVLAGQNESGKTAILQALRDFDLNEGLPPRTPDYTPDGRLDSAKSSLEPRALQDLSVVP
jgi:recombinational DNA repair ATPase RecF